MTLTPLQLRAVVQTLPADLPITDTFEGTHSGKAWYINQKQHLEGWLAEYNGPGAYHRRTHDGTARDFYQRFRCVAGLLWLAEALGESPEVLNAAVVDVQAAGDNLSSQCGAFRRAVPWARIEVLLQKHECAQSRPWLHRVHGAIAPGRVARVMFWPHRRR